MNRKLIEKVDSLLSEEKGTIFKDPGGKINICLVYPNTYHVGMSNLGFQGIYGLLNKRDDVVCERAFLPDNADIEEYRRTETPVFSYESKRPLSRFDIAAFSISFENDYPNILTILDISKIPFSSFKRNQYHPMLIAGGVCYFFNPEPIAPIFDIIFVSEAEESLNEFLYIYQRTEDRRQIKKGAMQIEGIYVPEFYEISYNTDGTISKRTPINNAPEKIKGRYFKDLSISPVTTSIITPEAGTERMRWVIDKRITEKDILDTSKLILNAGIENLRLYFIISLPAETGEDVAGIVEIIKKIRRLSDKGNVVLSISTFVPKPFTPFQWHTMEPLDSVKEKLKFIKKTLRDEKGVKIFHDVPKYAFMQGLFSVGDRRVFNVLRAMVKTDDYRSACSQAGVDMDFYIFRKKDFDEILPWDFIDAGISREKLWAEYIEAISQK